MVQRFIMKKPHKGYLTASPSKRIGVVSKKKRQVKKTMDEMLQHISASSVNKDDGELRLEVDENNPVISDDKENKTEKTVSEKMNEETIGQINDILSDENDMKRVRRKAKIERKEKGLLERTEDSTILITEDNKTLLTD